MTEIKYDQPIEVTLAQYRFIMFEFAAAVAGRVANGKYYIKVWLMKFAPDIKKIIDG